MRKDDFTQHFNKSQKKSDDVIADPTTTVERAAALKRSLELATQAVMEAKLNLLKVEEVFLRILRDHVGRNFTSKVDKDCGHSSRSNALDRFARYCK